MSSPYGDAVMHTVTVNHLGIPHYEIQVLQTGVIYTLSRVDLWRLTSVDELTQDVEFLVPNRTSDGDGEGNGDAPNEDQEQEPPAKRRFAVPLDEDQVDRLADERQAQVTLSQTRWAVRIFRGRFIIYFLLESLISKVYCLG